MLFRRLAVFVGGCTLEAAEAVAGAPGDLGVEPFRGSPRWWTRACCGTRRDRTGNPATRCWRRSASTGCDDWRRAARRPGRRQRHADHFMPWPQPRRSAPSLARTRQAGAARLDAERDNLRAALKWASAHGAAGRRSSGSRTALQTLLGDGGSLWRDTPGSSAPWSVKARFAPAPLFEHAVVLRVTGWVAQHQGDDGRAAGIGRERVCRWHVGSGRPRLSRFALTVAWLCGGGARAGALARVLPRGGPRVMVEQPERTRPGSPFPWRNLGRQALPGRATRSPSAEFEEALALFRREGHRYGAANVLKRNGGHRPQSGVYTRAAVLWRGA